MSTLPDPDPPVAGFDSHRPPVVMSSAANSHDDGAGATGPLDRLPLSSATLDEVRAALRRHLAEPGPEADEQLRHAFRALTRETRARGLTAERIVVLFKSVWYGLPEVQAARWPFQNDGLARAVTLCIETYYERATEH